jgi:hypothetical protein
MLNNVPVVPTLSKITDPMLKSRENVIMYLIRFLFVNPGGTTSINEGEMISFRKLVAMYGSRDPDQLANKISEMMTAAAAHYFPNDGINVVCQMVKEDGYREDGTYLGNYAIEIAARDRDGVAICPNASIKASTDGLDFKFVK